MLCARPSARGSLLYPPYKTPFYSPSGVPASVCSHTTLPDSDCCNVSISTRAIQLVFDLLSLLLICPNVAYNDL
jgi:hypothetical protein